MNKNSKVEEYFTKSSHPLKAEMEKVREIILSVHPSIEETIKWKVPTFMYKGNIGSFMNAKKFVSLMFHKGAFIKDEHGLLQGEGKETRVARFKDLKDIDEKRTALEAVIEAWIKMKDEA